MPRANLHGYSNAEEEVFYVSEAETATSLEDQEQQEGLDTAASAEADIAEDREDWTSAGTSSSTSGSSPDKSGTHSTTDPQSPAPTTDSHSSKDQPPSQESSTVHSTDGNGQETTSDQPSQPDSSAASAPRAQATPAQGTSKSKRSSAS